MDKQGQPEFLKINHFNRRAGRKVEEIFQNVDQKERDGKYEGKIKRRGGLIQEVQHLSGRNCRKNREHKGEKLSKERQEFSNWKEPLEIEPKKKIKILRTHIHCVKT